LSKVTSKYQLFFYRKNAWTTRAYSCQKTTLAVILCCNAFLHKIHQVQSISTISFIAKLQKSLELNSPKFWHLTLSSRGELAKNSFAAQTIIVRPLCISDRYLVLAQQISIWCIFDFSGENPNYAADRVSASSGNATELLCLQRY